MILLKDIQILVKYYVILLNMKQKDKLRESFLALVSIKSTANNIIDYCSEYSNEAANYAQEIKHKCEEVLKLLK